MDGNVISVERIVPATPDAIFGLLADAAKHPMFDGSGTVKEVKDGAGARLSLGSTFGMSMKMGVGYSTHNEVVELEDNRRIAWQTKPKGFARRFAGGRIWRYELDPVEGGTLVRESWDLSQDHQRAFMKLGGIPERTRRNMEHTLAKIEEVLASA
jgi:uncharacterized protein YndB with AHSA1/START domain